MSNVKLNELPLEGYISVVGQERIDKIQSLADELKEISVVNVNSTSFGGGVAEILKRLVPLMRGLQLKADR